ncbi:MAG TPA: serine hydrolase domain-containing protein [Candidatus Baltobacteraceae bacterium]|nr:serine hydrolase domain-containing protein [Candidatus Baltobacteraceae bacterium]
MDIDAAVAYGEKHELHALLIQQGGSMLLERYGDGYDAKKPHALYSGTKSFWGIAALEAQAEGLLDLDAIVLDAITPRMLLTMTAGYGFGGLGNAVPTYDRAMVVPLKTTPGSTFTYSGIPLQVFGGYFAQRLAPVKLTPHDYLRERILAKANVAVGSWRALSDGTHPLPTGAMLTANDWLRYGTYVLAHRARYAQAFVGTAANPRYGLCWWLGAAGAPPDCFYASGSAGQGLYVVPSEETVIVHFGKSSSYKHDAFLKRLFAPPR